MARLDLRPLRTGRTLMNLLHLSRAPIVAAGASVVFAGSSLLAPSSGAQASGSPTIVRNSSAAAAVRRLAAIPAPRYARTDPRRYISALRGSSTNLYASGIYPNNMVTSRIDPDHLPGRPHEPWASPAILRRIRLRVQRALVKAGETRRVAKMTRVKVLDNYFLSNQGLPGWPFTYGYVSWAVLAIWGPHRICGLMHVDPTMWGGWTDKEGASDSDDLTCGSIRDARGLELRGGTDQAPDGLFATWALVPDSVGRAQTIYNRRLGNIDGGKLAVNVPIVNNVATIANAAPWRHQVVRYLQVTLRDGSRQRLRIVSSGS